jgi:predicted nucleic acid-binding protein
MYFVGELRGWHGQAALWRYVKDGGLELHVPKPDEWVRISDLMEQYRDTPMDLADASLVSPAELCGLRRIITLDSDFYVYRVGGRESFDVILVTIS